MLSRLALRCLSRFASTSHTPGGARQHGASEAVLRRPSTTAPRGVKAGAVAVGVLPPYRANLRTPTALSVSRLDPPFRGPWSLINGRGRFPALGSAYGRRGGEADRETGGCHGTTHNAQQSTGHSPIHRGSLQGACPAPEPSLSARTTMAPTEQCSTTSTWSASKR